MDMNIPNSLTLLRILLLPIFIACMAYRAYGAALLVLVVAGLTDVIDGFLARQWNQQTRLGMVLDPLADKLFLSSTFLSLLMLHLVPSWLVILVVSRDVILLLGTALMHVTGTQLDMTPTLWGKGTTLLQLTYVFLVVFFAWLGLSFSILTPLVVAMVGFTLTSGFHYTYRGYCHITTSLPPA